MPVIRTYPISQTSIGDGLPKKIGNLVNLVVLLCISIPQDYCIYDYLVDGLEHFLWKIIDFHILPIDFHIFQDG